MASFRLLEGYDAWDRFYTAEPLKLDHLRARNESKNLEYKLKLDKDMLIASIDVPGVDIKDITIEVQERYLTITASREGQRQTTSFCINTDYDISLAEARLNSGVLKVFCPKRAAPVKKTIPISHG